MADDTTSTEDTGTEQDETSAQGTGEATSNESATEQQEKTAIPPEVERALRKANKEAETYRLKLKEIEDAQKTEQQLLAEKAAESQKELEELRAELLRNKVALAKKLPAELADRLRGDDEDSLMEDADRLLALVAQKQRPGGEIDQGHRGGTGPKQVIEAELKQMTPEQIDRALDEGRLANLL